MKGFLLIIIPYLICFVGLFTQCEGSNIIIIQEEIENDLFPRKIENTSQGAGSDASSERKGFLRKNVNRLLGDDNDDKDDKNDKKKDDEKKDDDEDWWDTQPSNNGGGGNGGGGGGRPQGRPGGTEDNHYDCESMMAYLDYLPPECQYLDNYMPDYVAAPTTAPPVATPIDDPNNNGFSDASNEDILIRMSFRVVLTQQLQPRKVYRLRAAVANSVSRVLHRKSPFHVPKPVLNDALLGFLGSISAIGANQGGGSRPPQGDGPRGGDNGGRPGDGTMSNNSPTLFDPTSMDPDAFTEEFSEDLGRGGRQKKGNLWLHHYNTDLFANVVHNTTTDRWYYPIEIKYFVFWNELDYLVEDAHILQNITRICQHIGNETLQNGELKMAVMEEIENDGGIFDDNIFGDDTVNEDESENWANDLMDLDGMGEGNDILGDGAQFPTYPTEFLASTWGRREYFGLYLMIATLLFATLMRVGATRSNADNDKVELLSPNRAPHFLTEEGVNEFLKVGWNYQKQSAAGDDASQLYLHVFDKSGVGYTKDNSMLMGGNEQIAGGVEDLSKPNHDHDNISPSNTASTEQETNSATHRESLTTRDSSDRKSSRNSGESSSRTRSSSFAYDDAPSSELSSEISERKSGGTRKSRSSSGGKKSSRSSKSEGKSHKRRSSSKSSQTSERKSHGKKSKSKKTRTSDSDISGKSASSHSKRDTTTTGATTSTKKKKHKKSSKSDKSGKGKGKGP